MCSNCNHIHVLFSSYATYQVRLFTGCVLIAATRCTCRASSYEASELDPPSCSFLWVLCCSVICCLCSTCLSYIVVCLFIGFFPMALSVWFLLMSDCNAYVASISFVLSHTSVGGVFIQLTRTTPGVTPGA